MVIAPRVSRSAINPTKDIVQALDTLFVVKTIQRKVGPIDI
jgi:hypothetical protein